MGVVAKRSSMTFFSDSTSQYSHRVRIVLAEKGVAVEVIESDAAHPPPQLASLNPYNNLPTLVDRELVLYESKVMMEYLDERFPHPPLLPVYPVARAESRLYIHRIEKDWCALVDSIHHSRSENVINKSTKELRESLLAIAPIFNEKPFFMSATLHIQSTHTPLTYTCYTHTHRTHHMLHTLTPHTHIHTHHTLIVYHTQHTHITHL